MYAPFSTSIDRVTGVVTVDLAPYIPVNMIAAPSGTTHYLLTAMAAAIDFEGQNFTVDAAASGSLPWTAAPTAPLQLTMNLPLASTHPLFLVFGISFLQAVNGIDYPLKNGAFNAMAIVKVNGV